ncbi:rRNA maturation RNase YbeY [Malacoplasma iowae]|uniref:rRNA maturation RNase YbeY n=1 Tax=Malacoplasma iowae TaxID=2116 RepID=UPI0038734673|nr:rRNA maturation RNase YbeY [Malacoplasma iowae]
MFKIQINDKYNFLDKKMLSLIKKASKIIFLSEKLKGKLIFEISIQNNDESKEMNNSFRKKNYPTDVITFSFWDNNEFKTNLVGEIYLNYEKTISQSKEYNHSIYRETLFLICHGIYHLLGYDHQNENDKKIMLNKQYNVLDKIKLGNRSVK